MIVTRKGAFSLWQWFRIFSARRRSSSAAACPVCAPAVNANARTFAARSAANSFGRLRIMRSRVRTTQPCTPASVSHSSSGAPCPKRSATVWTIAPSSRSASGTIFAPTDSSTRKVSPSSGLELEVKLAADSFGNGAGLYPVIFGKCRFVLAGFEPLCQHSSRNSGPDQDGPTKGDLGVNHDV